MGDVASDSEHEWAMNAEHDPCASWYRMGYERARAETSALASEAVSYRRYLTGASVPAKIRLRDAVDRFLGRPLASVSGG